MVANRLHTITIVRTPLPSNVNVLKSHIEVYHREHICAHEAVEGANTIFEKWHETLVTCNALWDTIVGFHPQRITDPNYSIRYGMNCT